MKKKNPVIAHTPSSLRKLSAFLLLSSLATAAAFADTVYVSGCVSNCVSTTTCGNGENPNTNPNTGNPVYTDNGLSGYTSAKASGAGVTDKPVTPGSRYFSTAFTNSSNPTYGITVNPNLAVPGAVYRVDHTFSASAGNISTTVIVGVTNTAGCTLSWTNTTLFQSAYGNSTWQTLGYLTNSPGSSNPQLTFYWAGGTVDAGLQSRMEVDTFRFVINQPCLTVASPSITGPLATNTPYVTVTGVSNNATEVTVYQDSGSGMTSIGTTNLTSPGATVVVHVVGLVAGAQVGATQTIGGQESCVPTAGTLVGIGPNTSLGIALSIRGNPNLTGPVWTTAGGTNSDVYFLGASAIGSGAVPADPMIVFPSNNWQTITLQRGPDSLNPINPTVLWNNGSGSATPDIEGDYGALDGIAFVCNGDPGYYDIYIDDIANGTNGVLENFEGDTQGTTFGFSQPSFSGTTSGFLLGAPNISTISGNAATSGTNSTRVQWQFISGSTNQWLRLVHSGNSGLANPQVNLNEPISFRLLLLGPGQSLPALPPAPVNITGIRGTSLTYSNGGGSQFVLLKSASANAALSSWTRTATNTATPGTFTIPAVGASSRLFYIIKSE
jgi:hypothetical protein